MGGHTFMTLLNHCVNVKHVHVSSNTVQRRLVQGVLWGVRVELGGHLRVGLPPHIYHILVIKGLALLMANGFWHILCQEVPNCVFVDCDLGQALKHSSPDTIDGMRLSKWHRGVIKLYRKVVNGKDRASQSGDENLQYLQVLLLAKQRQEDPNLRLRNFHTQQRNFSSAQSSLHGLIVDCGKALTRPSKTLRLDSSSPVCVLQWHLHFATYSHQTLFKLQSSDF
eukprot:365665-Chlamydomonas_euryale.AAC.9